MIGEDKNTPEENSAAGDEPEEVAADAGAADEPVEPVAGDDVVAEAEALVEAAAKAVEEEAAAEQVEEDPLAVAIAERDSYIEALQRMQADFANFRKQTEKRASDVRATAATSVVEELLPVLDACDAAILSGATDVAPIHSALLDALGKKGLEVQSPDGEPFDPELHEAVMTEEGEGEPVVAEVLRTGYVLNGRVVRPAMVKVRG